MNKTTRATLAAAVLSISAVASAQQSNTGLTRAQVRAERVQIEKAGYKPARHNDPYYPADIQAAEARLQPGDSVTQNTITSGFGGAADGFSQTGTSTTTSLAGRPVYSGH
ncbi:MULTISPECIES: DUF4148 domain-containing protein [Paraburkholderia]|uniref:DUF4148 domain-containing protein n=1 Tax=Paraburkholderia TaxID=1822464 RepID=UPI00224CBF5F|nr:MULTISPECIES: DUF4148 domain-containing protein [Paraburkholderia]MCX4155038.1 DUF4148 domain-containing protein [Paraburkholderia aspalathi]MDN7164448.1 DUF4148 domain-containing protein [Paraburkholderia sp. SECH2]MDQ6392933.1 DUF4148 domain-containing protein [Paraburkholderia aspalathi]